MTPGTSSPSSAVASSPHAWLHEFVLEDLQSQLEDEARRRDVCGVGDFEVVEVDDDDDGDDVGTSNTDTQQPPQKEQLQLPHRRHRRRQRRHGSSSIPRLVQIVAGPSPSPRPIVQGGIPTSPSSSSPPPWLLITDGHHSIRAYCTGTALRRLRRRQTWTPHGGGGGGGDGVGDDTARTAETATATTTTAPNVDVGYNDDDKEDAERVAAPTTTTTSAAVNDDYSRGRCVLIRDYEIRVRMESVGEDDDVGDANEHGDGGMISDQQPTLELAVSFLEARPGFQLDHIGRGGSSGGGRRLRRTRQGGHSTGGGTMEIQPIQDAVEVRFALQASDASTWEAIAQRQKDDDENDENDDDDNNNDDDEEDTSLLEGTMNSPTKGSQNRRKQQQQLHTPDPVSGANADILPGRSALSTQPPPPLGDVHKVLEQPTMFSRLLQMARTAVFRQQDNGMGGRDHPHQHQQQPQQEHPQPPQQPPPPQPTLEQPPQEQLPSPTSPLSQTQTQPLLQTQTEEEDESNVDDDEDIRHREERSIQNVLALTPHPTPRRRGHQVEDEVMGMLQTQPETPTQHDHDNNGDGDDGTVSRPVPPLQPLPSSSTHNRKKRKAELQGEHSSSSRRSPIDHHNECHTPHLPPTPPRRHRPFLVPTTANLWENLSRQLEDPSYGRLVFVPDPPPFGNDVDADGDDAAAGQVPPNKLEPPQKREHGGDEQLPQSTPVPTNRHNKRRRQRHRRLSLQEWLDRCRTKTTK